MHIISPLMFLTLYLTNQGSFIGYVLLRMILKVYISIGIMLPIQTAFQMMAEISISSPALVTKMLIFVILALFAEFFEHRIKRETKYIKELVFTIPAVKYIDFIVLSAVIKLLTGYVKILH